MSHVQFEFDAHNKANAIATAAKVSRQWVITGLVDLWMHCFRERTDKVSTILITGFFSEPIGHVLEAFDFLEHIDETTWRVRGMSRYTSLSEKRKQAGRRGGRATQAAREEPSKTEQTANGDSDLPQAKEANGTFAQASTKQLLQKRSKHQASAQANGVANAENGEQNKALYPRSENSPLKGRESSRTNVRSSSRAEAAPPPSGGGTAAQVEGSARPVKPPRPKLIPGTPEYREAEAMGDWVALGWVKG